MNKLPSIVLIIFLLTATLHGQVKIGTNPTVVNNSASLEIESSNKGLLIPRVSLLSTTDVATIPSPAQSLLVYNLSTTADVVPGFYYWNSVWIPLKTSVGSSSGTYWGVGGNTASTSDFFGTTNYTPLVLKINNNSFGKFYPNGGITLGNGATANENNSIAIGTNANASNNIQSTAISTSATASGYQATALGYGSAAKNNNTMALGYLAAASGYQATALGSEATSSGQYATAIGYQATASQDNSIVLGNSSNNSNKVGIGTNTPEERLHIVGSLKLVDGTQGNGYVLTSDTNGKAHWQNQSSSRYYGDTYYNSSGQSVNQYNNISFGTVNTSNGVTVDSDGITVTNAGTYKITYRITISKTSGNTAVVPFNIYKNYSTLIPGSLSTITIGNSETNTATGSVIVALNAYDKVSVRSSISDSTIVYQTNGVSLTLEFIE